MIPITVSKKRIERMNLSCFVVLRSINTEWIEIGIRARSRVF